MTEATKYVGGATGGVPDYIFSNTFGREYVSGASGTSTLDCLVKPHLLNIRVLGQEEEVTIWAGINDGRLSLNLHNKGKNSARERHPDIYAGALVRRFVTFAQENGEPITSIHGSWAYTSDNFKQFTDYLKEIQQKREISAEDKRAAARSTWTGRLAHSLGYSKVWINPQLPTETTIRTVFTKANKL